MTAFGQTEHSGADGEASPSAAQRRSRAYSVTTVPSESVAWNVLQLLNEPAGPTAAKPLRSMIFGREVPQGQLMAMETTSGLVNPMITSGRSDAGWLSENATTGLALLPRSSALPIGGRARTRAPGPPVAADHRRALLIGDLATPSSRCGREDSNSAVR